MTLQTKWSWCRHVGPCTWKRNIFFIFVLSLSLPFLPFLWNFEFSLLRVCIELLILWRVNIAYVNASPKLVFPFPLNTRIYKGIQSHVRMFIFVYVFICVCVCWVEGKSTEEQIERRGDGIHLREVKYLHLCVCFVWSFILRCVKKVVVVFSHLHILIYSPVFFLLKR